MFYDAAKGGRHGVQTDAAGRFSLPLHKGMRVVVSSVGYESFSTRAVGGDSLIVRLKPADFAVGTAVVQAKRSKYSRKNNPAVILMEKVIAAKKAGDLRNRDFYSFEKYNKLTFALSDITPEFFEEGGIKTHALSQRTRRDLDRNGQTHSPRFGRRNRFARDLQ